MPIHYHGSSRIKDISQPGAITGATGYTGITAGASGPTGPIGNVGVAGTIGVGIDSFHSSSGIGGESFAFNLTDGTVMGITGAMGATGDGSAGDGYHYIFDVDNTHSGATVGKIVSTVAGVGSWNSETGTENFVTTASFRGITTSGRDINVIAGGSGDTIILSGSTAPYGRIGNTGELVYVFKGNGYGGSGHGALNTHWAGCTTSPIMTGPTGHLQARFAVIRGATISNNTKSPSGVTNARFVAQQTNDSEGKGSTGSVVPFTYIVKPNDDYQIQSGFHMGHSGGDAVLHTFDATTHDTVYKLQDFGSCCFCKDNVVQGETDYPGCLDYVSSQYCSEVGGVWDSTTCLSRPEGPDCYSEGACCVNGICAETSLNKCRNIYGGFYVQGMSCTDVENLGGCPEPCEETGACCIGGGCFEMSGYQCSFEPNGIFVTGGSCNPNQENYVNCCIEAVYGACCVDEKCFETTPDICRTLRAEDSSPGLFWGVGSRCGGPSRMDGGGWYDNPENCKNDGKDCAAYAPFNCTYAIEQGGDEWEGTRGSIDAAGNCLGCTTGYCPPPCAPCIGWSQLTSGELIDGNVCGDPWEPGGECPCPCGTCAPTQDISYSGCQGTCCAHEQTSGDWECEKTTRMQCAAYNDDVDANYDIIRWSGCLNEDQELSCNGVLGQNESLCSDVLSECIYQSPSQSPDVMIVLDSSLTMYLNADKIKPALISLVDMLNPSLTKIGFTDSKLANTSVDTSLTYNHAIVKESINSLSRGADVLHHPLELAYNDLLLNSQQKNGATNHEIAVIVLSTGSLRSGEEWDAAIHSASKLKECCVCDDQCTDQEREICEHCFTTSDGNPLKIYSISIGASDGNIPKMQDISSGELYHVNLEEFEELETELTKLAHKLTCGGEDVTSAFVRQSCGSILLSDGSCWECCCDHDGTGLGDYSGGDAGIGIIDPLNLNCCSDSGDGPPSTCASSSDTINLMTSCCWWREEYGDPFCQTVGRMCAWPGGGSEPAHPWLSSKEVCMGMLGGTTISETGGDCSNTDADPCCGSNTCNDSELDPGCCCFPDGWTLPEEINWLEDVDDPQIPNAGDCIVQSYGEWNAKQMNKYRCGFFGGCWIENGVCDGGIYGGDCPHNDATICGGQYCLPPNGCP
jgi:hypothetical protein